MRMHDSLTNGADPPAGSPAVGELLARAQRVLAEGGVLRPRPNAERLMAHVLGVERYRLYLDFAQGVPPEAETRFAELVERRATGEPLQYLTGSTEFMSLDFLTRPGALIPRPETEILVETALAFIESSPRSSRVIPFPSILEVGTGSGAVALSLAHYLPASLVYATEISPAALELARENAVSLGLESRVRFFEGDMCDPLEGEGLTGSFSVLISNPPYVPRGAIPSLPREVRDHEPRLALDGGADGLDMVRRLIEEAPRWLRPGGRLFFEVGAGQARPAAGLAEGRPEWEGTRVVCDYTGIERVVEARRRGGEEWTA